MIIIIYCGLLKPFFCTIPPARHFYKSNLLFVSEITLERYTSQESTLRVVVKDIIFRGNFHLAIVCIPSGCIMVGILHKNKILFCSLKVLELYLKFKRYFVFRDPNIKFQVSTCRRIFQLRMFSCIHIFF
jgi:hypothetical protein